MMARLSELLLFSLIPLLVLFHLYISPFTKVEESFNIQAVHDVLRHGIPVKDPVDYFSEYYDHFTFPGPVPRTFVGALVLAGIARPFIWLNGYISRQLLVRGILGLFNSFALISYANGIKKAFGKHAAVWYILFQASQFHVIYYASRTLPNMFAFGITTLAMRNLLPDITSNVKSTSPSGRYRLSLYLFTIAGIIFRSEIAMFLATTTIYHWAIAGHISLRREIIPAGVAGVLVGLTITVAIDSFFWQKFYIWPELTSFIYNVVSGHASEWGIQPWHYYFVNAVPRLLLNPLTYLICIPLACARSPHSKAIYAQLLPALSYIAIHSLQPHKEWRFIVYAIPPLTSTAALGASYIWTHRTKSIFYRLTSMALILSTLATFAISSFILLPISMANYPGAHALNAVHKHAHGSKTMVFVHLDNLSCQTGVTHFLELAPPKSFNGITRSSPGEMGVNDRWTSSRWVYDRTEHEEMKKTFTFWERFDYALVEDVNAPGGDGEWTSIYDSFGFSGVKVLRPGDKGSERTAEREFIRKIFGDDAVKCWEVVEGFARKYVTGGWWVEASMVPKISVMKHINRDFV